MSYEHKRYLRKLKLNRICIFISQILIFIIILAIWQILANFNLINTFITSSPKKVLDTIIELHNSNNLYHHIWVTTYETIISFSLGSIIGIIIATILWRINFLAKILEPYLTILNSLPKVALGPIILIWFGANIKAIIIMALLISVIVNVINVYQGFIHVDNNRLKLMQSFGAKLWQIYCKLIFPETLPNIISTIKISISMSLIGA